ncbi:MAG: class I SAM-dependent methyltransferase [Actinomycetota bacterium]
MSPAAGDFIDKNRGVWDEWTERRFTPGFQKIESFDAGEEILQPFEIDELGPVEGKSLLHLQCHFGLDTLAWARRGARVTGVDFSDRSIELASKLAADLGYPEARFVASDVLRLPEVLDGRFDIVYTSFGVLAWLPDLNKWAEVIDHFLAPGGTFYIAEYHPFPLVFDESGPAFDPTLRNPYFRPSDPIAYSGDEGGDFTVYGWPYTLGEVVTSLASVGLRIEFLHELPFSESPHVGYLVPHEDGSWRLPSEVDGELPLVFSLRAAKPEVR